MDQHTPETTRSSRFPWWALLLGLAVSLIGIVVINSMEARATQVEQQHGLVLLYDEILTMSARMSVAEGLVERCDFDPGAHPEAVAEGQAFWRARYRKAEEALDVALATLSDLAWGALSTQVNQTSEANQALIDIENSGLEATTCAGLLAARDALNGAEYQRLKGEYLAGTTAVVHAVRAQIGTARVIAGVIVITLAAVWLLGIQTIRRWRRRLVAAERQLADRLLQDNAALQDQTVALRDQVTHHSQIAEHRQDNIESLVRALLRTEQEERERLARWVHDELQQYLVSTRQRPPSSVL